MREYPRIGSIVRKEKGICKICKKPAKYRVDIEVNYFRGDDEVEKRCEEHKRVLIEQAKKSPTPQHLTGEE